MRKSTITTTSTSGHCPATKTDKSRSLVFLFQFSIFLLMMVASPILNTSCVAVAAVGAGAGAYAYLRGSLDSHLSADFDQCLAAVRKEVPRMGYVKVRELSDQSSAKFIFRDTFDTKISIHLSQRSGGMTEITIRVGQLGDEDRSIQILNQINRELEPTSPSAR